MASKPALNETALRETFLLVRDAHERLAFIVDACAGQGLALELRREADRVPACVSPVWLCGEAEHGLLQLRWDAISPLVRGLVGLICRVYQGCEVGEICSHQSTLLTDLELDRQLSPTRLRGLAMVQEWICCFATRNDI